MDHVAAQPADLTEGSSPPAPPGTLRVSEMFVSVNTVKTHTRNLYGKLGVRSRPELTAMLFHQRDVR